tara:strand:- start:397 stop:516 length:120 start_codon:yes stop_codon:yes gene_type:complete
MTEIIIVFEESDCELLIDVEAMKAYNESLSAWMALTTQE